MWIVNLILIFLLQASTASPPVQKIVVGLGDGRQIVMENTVFSGFIEGRNGDAILMYRQPKVHGEMPMKTISRIDFGEYKKGKPFPLTVTLRNGQKIQVESERRDFVTLKGKTDLGVVTIKHPDPASAPLKLSTKKPNRKKDLTIQYLEMPAS